MTDLSTYQPPGVYVNDASLPYADAINPVFGDHTICIVAPSRGYQTATETVSLRSATPTPLFNTGVNQDATLVVTTLAGTVLTLGTDYQVTVNNSVPSAPVTSLTRLPSTPATVSPGGVADGDSVTVSYTYTDASYWNPTRFSSFADIAAKYGDPLATTIGDSQIPSPLSLAAQTAFENGASSVLCVPVTGTSTGTWQTAFKNAYSKLVAIPSISVIVPIFPTSVSSNAATYRSFLIDLRAHVIEAYANGHGRMALSGAGIGYDETSAPFSQVAQAVSNKRVAVVYPPVVQLYNSNTSQVIDVDGAYAAAAAGGRLMLNPVDRGLTSQILNTVTGVSTSMAGKMTKTFMNTLSSAGVLVLAPNANGRLAVRHGVTTDMSDITTREISLVRIGDTLLDDIQVGMDSAGLIGSPITAETPAQVQTILIGCLEQEIADQVILTYGNVQASQQTYPGGDPSVINCSFAYKPAAPLNYIQVQFTLNMNIGTVDAATSDTTSSTPLSSPDSTNSTTASGA